MGQMGYTLAWSKRHHHLEYFAFATALSCCRYPMCCTLHQKGDSTPIHLACPFWKLDPLGRKDCRDKKLRNVSDVRTHLQRAHMQPDFCLGCKPVLNPDRNLNDHIHHAN
ncbi:hypothetical protein QBC41DRAFT_324605 [Cercophora samala]|uniref:Uncharacterized protein n=1 Tax=Cercophora samala TaxID=330535 RepID=A0AA39ZA26_9PEZI|nr:hypothetical protein QBC41DRAFT_324605 [Cercophora samala]